MISPTNLVGDTYDFVVAVQTTYGPLPRLGQDAVTAGRVWKSFLKRCCARGNRG